MRISDWSADVGSSDLEFEAQRHRARYGKCVAVAAQDRKVERFAAARFLIAVFLQLEIVDGDHRAKREAAAARVVGERTRSRPQRGVPLALHRLFDVFGASLGAEDKLGRASCRERGCQYV